MTTSSRALLASLFLFSPLTGGLHAQPYSVDENGSGIQYEFFQPHAMPFFFGIDPSGGLANTDVLYYTLGGIVDSGDVELMRPGGGLDAMLRFYTPPGAFQTDLILYSVPNGTLAGTGIPAPSDNIQITETGANTSWSPEFYQPGSYDYPRPVFSIFEYTVATPVPEPSTAALLTMVGISGLIGRAGRLTIKRHRAPPFVTSFDYAEVKAGSSV